MKDKKEEIHNKLKNLLKVERNAALYKEIKSLFLEHRPIGHNWEHVERDIINAVYIGSQEKADMDIVLPAVILHDLGYITDPKDPPGHGANGARECYRYLTAWSPEDQDKIANCILKHKGKYPGYEGNEPVTLEEKVVCDADQIDKFGWVGFMQMFLVYIERSMTAEGYPGPMTGISGFMRHNDAITYYTETAVKIAKELKEPDFEHIATQLEEELNFYKMTD